MNNTVYLIVIERTDGHKSAYSHKRHISGLVTDQVFEKPIAEEILLLMKNHFMSMKHVRDVYLKEVDL